MRTSNPVPTSVPSNSNLRNRQWLTHPKPPNSLHYLQFTLATSFNCWYNPRKICGAYTQTNYIFNPQIHHFLHDIMSPFLPKRKLNSETLLLWRWVVAVITTAQFYSSGAVV